MRFGSRVIIMLARGAKISVARGSRLILGLNTTHAAGPPCSLRLRPNARLTVHGNAEIFRGTSVLVSDNAHLEMGRKSYINFDSTVIWKVIQEPDSLREVYFPLRRVATIRMTCS